METFLSVLADMGTDVIVGAALVGLVVVWLVATGQLVPKSQVSQRFEEWKVLLDKQDSLIESVQQVTQMADLLRKILEETYHD